MICASLYAVAAEPSPATVTDANITGHVIDGEDDSHIAYCAIKILGTQTFALTNNGGHYVLRDLTPGTYKIEASMTGYRSEMREVKVEKDKTIEVNFKLQPDVFMLDQVVVTSSRSEIKKINSPGLINILDASTLERANAKTLADGLNYQPGVRVENNCQNCGFTQVRINGLDGHYSQILMNSRPVFSALAGVYGLEHIPANMIERVEIMRGGGSALFGSSAIGGTINIITKDPVVNSAQVSHTLTSIGITGALDNNTTLNASVVTDDNRAGLFMYGQSRHRDGYDHDGDGFTEIAKLNATTIGTRGFLRTSDDTRLTLDYHHTNEFRRGGDNIDLQPDRAMVAEQTDHNIHAGEASFDIWSRNRKDHVNIFGAAQMTKRASYYGSDMDPDAFGRTSDMTVSTGAQWTHGMEKFWFMPAELVAGVEYNYNYLHDVTLGYDHDVTQRVNIYSAYAQNEWRDDRWGFLVGARLDKHSLISSPIFSPRLNLRYNPRNNVNLRLSYATGFRSPQAYDEDFHVAVVGGERVVTILAPGLKQERSNSLSASADIYPRFGSVMTNFTFEAFYTDLSDVFAIRKLDEPDENGNAVLERYNGGGATVAGFNFEAGARFSSRFQSQLGLTWQRSRYKDPEEWSEDPLVPAVKRMFRTPDLYGYLTLNYNVTKKLVLGFTSTYTGSMLVQHFAGSGTDIDVAVTTPSFFDASFKASYCFEILGHVDVDVSASIDNIFNAYQKDFDQGALRDSGYMYGPMTPRSLTFGIKLSI